MKTTAFLFLLASTLAIPATADADTAVLEASVTKAGKRTPIAALTLDVADDGSTTEAEAATAGGVFEVAMWRPGRKAAAGDLRFRVAVNRGSAGHFKLRSARTVKPGVRTVIGSFRQASGELLEIAATIQP